MTERRTGGSSQTAGGAETGRQREGGRGRASRRGRERAAAARPPCRHPPLSEGSAGGTEWQSGRDAGAEDRRTVPASLVGPRGAEGPPRGAARRDGGKPAAGCRTEGQTARQTGVPGTDWQPGGGSALPLRSQGPRRRRQRPPSASEQRGAAGTSGSPADAAAVGAARGATALPGAPRRRRRLFLLAVK